ncbi:MAG: hypothetical protein WAT39_16910 [Planctomycetota bacterium]
MPELLPSPGTKAERSLTWVLLAAAAAAFAVFAFGVANRCCYPHELEWMEGALADHAWRVAHRLSVYCEPGPEHVPFLYAPLLFWLGGLGITLGFDGITALRLVSIACTIGSAMLVGHWVRREAGNVATGLAASGLFFAGYGWLAWWYDLARNDTLFVSCMLAVGYQLRHGGPRRWLWAAVLATLAVLAKQSALMWLPAIAVGAACRDWRTAARSVVATALLAGVVLGVMHWTSDGWSTFFLFEMPRHHGIVGEFKLAFWTRDLQPMLPLLALGLWGFVAQWRAGKRGDALFLAAFGSGALVTSWLSRMHVGGFDNVLMYGFAGACVLGPIAAAGVPPGRWRTVALLLWLAQFGWLGFAACHRGAATWLPSDAHRRGHQELAVFVAAQPGAVWIPGHGAISTRAGKGTGAHGQAIFDLLQLLPKLPNGMMDLAALSDPSRLAHLSPRAQQALASFSAATTASLRAHRFAAIVVDRFGSGQVDAWTGLFGSALVGADGQLGTDDDVYVRLPGPVLTEPASIKPLLGYEVHSPHALVPGAK